MNMLRDVGAAEIKEPFLDRPGDADGSGGPISEGTRVSLRYHGEPVYAQVTAIERLGTSFVGCVRSVSRDDLQPDALSPGDHIRFRLGDVCGVD